VVSMIASSVVSAQEITPNVVQEGRVWSLYKGMSMGEMLRFTGENPVLFFGADTLIDGKAYKNVLYRRVFHWENFDELPSYDWGCAMREEDSKVYHYDYETKEERLMFDFSLKPGDTVETYSKFVVTEAGVLAGDNHLHYIDLRDIERGCDDRWIERIGSQTSGIFWNDCWCCAGYMNRLACCKEKDDKGPFYFGKYFSECLSAEYATFMGEIAFFSDPPSSQTYLPNSDTSTLWAVIDNLKEQEYDALKRMTLMRNSTPFAQKLVVDGVEYFAGDKVEVIGWRSSDMKSGGGTDSYLEIHSIKKKDNVGVEISEKAELRVSPNPAKETITLTAMGCKLQKVEILDVNGRVLYAATLNCTETFDYNVSQMPSGFYLARVKTPCGVLTEKFSVK
ncbi:MAG: T9SS type A sorting domain-containing protein, partial [Bacteroidales bacterium]|nr:T9SS type A sorting domain-containing protein [Bacteroidales bacterium]